MIEVVPIATTSLGDRSYLATDGTVALVVDPQRDIDRVTAVADERGVTITHVFETHLHNDYVTGGLALARSVGAEYLTSAGDAVSFARSAVRDGAVIDVGGMCVRALHTPGHTFTHLSYALEFSGDVAGVFTGGSLLFGSTGRPDLLGDEKAEHLARLQFRSAGRLVRELPGDAQVFPTHGFGSFCSANLVANDDSCSTLLREMARNPVLTCSEDEYVRELLSNLTPYPAYYAHIAGLNRSGPAAADLSLPREADPEELARRIALGEWVVDLRNRRLFADRHLRGTLNFGLDSGFATHLGWLVPWGTPLTLIGDRAEDIVRAQRELVRIGIDRPAAFATTDRALPADAAASGSFAVADFAALGKATQTGKPFILDVRGHHERRDSAIAGSTHIPLPELLSRVHDVPADSDIWVHCAGGYRASVAASILARVGHVVIAIDDQFVNAERAGLMSETRAA